MRLHWSNAGSQRARASFEAAQAAINRAIGLLELTEDTTHLGRAHLVAAEISLWDGDLGEAADHLASAERLLPEGCDVEDRAFLIIQQAFLAAR